MILPEIENARKNQEAVSWLNEAKPIEERDAIIQNKIIARKALERNDNRAGGSASKTTSNDNTKRACLCSPTTHVGSFRCRLHRTTSSLKRPSVSPKDVVRPQQQEGKGENDRIIGSFGVSHVAVRTVSSGDQPRLSRFGRDACDKMPVVMASSKPEQVK